MKAPTNGFLANTAEGERKIINPELWHACAGPLVSLPPMGSLVVYFPQGHSEQVAASMHKQTDFIPSYPNLPSKLICMLRNVTLHADPETDEVYAQMTLQPVSKYDQEALLASEMALKQNRQPTEFFCKTLTASDTSTHGGFSVPRRAAEKIFPPLDFSMQPPAQELSAKDIHDHTWTFRHIYRGQPKRHLLTTGWSVFVSTKRVYAGDSVLFIRDDKQQLLLGIKHANRQQPPLSSSVISSDSMHIGILAAAAHAAANNTPFTIFYNPRACPTEFVVPFAKYQKAMFTQVSMGMRFRMMFETEESGVRRHMGTITNISDLDPVRWKGSQWRNLQVGWDESTASERPSRVSIWDIEPVVTPFYICPPPFFRPKFPRLSGMQDDESDVENPFKRSMPWLGDDFGLKDAPNSIFPGLSLVQWMSMQQNNQFSGAQPGLITSTVTSTALHNISMDDPSKLLSFQAPSLPASSLQFSQASQQSHVNPLPQPSVTWPQQQQSLQTLSNQQQVMQRLQLQHQPVQQEAQLQPQQGQSHITQSGVNNVSVASNYAPIHNFQQPLLSPQLQQQQPLTGSAQQTQGILSSSKIPFQPGSLPQDPKFLQVEQRPDVLQKHNQPTQLPTSSPQSSLIQKSQQPSQVQPLSQQGLLDKQVQLQLLWKLQQQQQQQLVSPSNPLLQPHLLQKQSSHQQNQQLQQLPLAQQSQYLSSNSISISALMQSQNLPVTQSPSHKAAPTINVHSGRMEGDAPSSSTSPSADNSNISPSKFSNKNQIQPGIPMGDSVAELSSNVVQEVQSKPDVPVKHELLNARGPDQAKFKAMVANQLEASSSATSHCQDAGNMPISLPSFCLDGAAQSHLQSSLPVTSNIDGSASDALLLRGYDPQKDLQNLLSTYGGTSGDIDPELSARAMGSQPFGALNMPFDRGCSNDAPNNEAGVLTSGLWANQTQRMRTFTKVQKRGSVGRTIDVTRYKGYDELRHDLARMFGIEGQLEDSQRTEWKLVYVDHEKDVLLVGDDPWEEFVSCVQSIKILSAAEVQQMSLDGDLGNVPIPNQACSGTDSGNAWRRQYEDISAASFN